MKTAKLSFDLSDHPEMIEMLRFQAATTQKSQKAILIQALEAYFSHQLESRLILSAAEKVFSEWDSKEDEVYNSF